MAGLALIALPSCQRDVAMASTPPSVEVVPVIQKDLPIYTEWVASTDGFVNATIRAQVQGYLLKQNYREGDLVKEGDLLFEIDPRPFKASLDRANAVLKESEAACNKAKAEVVRNQAQYDTTKTDLDRIKPLAAERAVSQKDLDDAIGAERSAGAAVVAAQAAAGAAAASVSVAKTAVEKAELDMGFTKIISPITGIAGIAKAQVGDLVGPNQGGELATVSTVDPIKVYFSTSEQTYIDYMEKFTDGAAAVEQEREAEYDLVLADGRVYPHKGKFYAFDREVDMRTGTIRIELLFPNPDNMLRPGQFAKVRKPEERKGALLVPQRAVTELQGNHQVAVVEAGNKVEIRTVKPGDRVDNMWVIDEGLKPGEMVVAEGTQKVRDGIQVNAIAANPAPTLPASPTILPAAAPRAPGAAPAEAKAEAQ